jgi:hypothetical protein
MDSSKPFNFKVTMPPGLSEKEAADVLDAVFEVLNVGAPPAKPEHKPRVELGDNCPGVTFLQWNWEQKGKDSRWER